MNLNSLDEDENINKVMSSSSSKTTLYMTSAAFFQHIRPGGFSEAEITFKGHAISIQE